MRYEELLDHWEGMIAPYRQAANGNGDTADLGLLGLGSHFARADKMLDQIVLDTPRQENAAILSHIENAAAFTVNQELQIADANPAAISTLQLAPGMSLSQLPLDEEDRKAFSVQVERMLLANHDAPMVFRARSPKFERLVVFHLRVIRPASGPAFAIAVSSEVAWPEGFDSMLQNAFNFSDTETKVVHSLTQCLSLKDIAAARGRSVDTVRAQLKSIMTKTDTRSQTELVRLTLGMIEMASYSEGAAAKLPDQSKGYDTLEPRPFYSLSLRDGRKLEFLILGDPNGRPCLFSPLDYGLVRWPASAEAAAAKRGMKIIVPVRAGYGKSTPLPKGVEAGNSTVQDYAELMDHLGIEKCPILSLGGDFFFSALFHSLFPGRVTAMLGCAGVLPLDRPEQYERMDKWHRFILAGARYTPHLLPFMVKGGFALARRLGKRGFVHAVRSHGLWLRGGVVRYTQRTRCLCQRSCHPRTSGMGTSRESPKGRCSRSFLQWASGSAGARIDAERPSTELSVDQVSCISRCGPAGVFSKVARCFGCFRGLSLNVFYGHFVCVKSQVTRDSRDIFMRRFITPRGVIDKTAFGYDTKMCRLAFMRAGCCGVGAV